MWSTHVLAHQPIPSSITSAVLGLVLWRRRLRRRLHQAAAAQQAQEWVPPGQENLRPGRLTMQFSSQQDEAVQGTQPEQLGPAPPVPAKAAAASDGKAEGHGISAVHVIADGGAAAEGLIAAGGLPAGTASSPAQFAAGLPMLCLDAMPSAPPAPDSVLYSAQPEEADDATDLDTLARELERQEMLLQQELALLHQQPPQNSGLAALQAQDSELTALEAQLMRQLQDAEEKEQQQQAQQAPLEQQQAQQAGQAEQDQHGEQPEQPVDQQAQQSSKPAPEQPRGRPAEQPPPVGTVSAMLQALQQALGNGPVGAAATAVQRPRGVPVRGISSGGRGSRHVAARSGIGASSSVAAEPPHNQPAAGRGRSQPTSLTPHGARGAASSSTRAGPQARSGPSVRRPPGAQGPPAWPAPPSLAGSRTATDSRPPEGVATVREWQNNPMAGGPAGSEQQELTAPQRRLRRMSSALRARTRGGS